MEYTNEILEKINSLKQVNKRYSRYYYKWSLEEKKLLNFSSRLKKNSDRILYCMNLFQWDLYEKNKLMDLKRVNRCSNNRVCPNCRKLDLSKAIHNFNPAYKKMLDDGYNAYMLTLTIPNCPGGNLSDTITLLYRNWVKFFNGYYRQDKKSFKFRGVEFAAALKVLEITYNLQNDTYHPHLHCIVFAKDIEQAVLHKYLVGHYSKKRGTYNLHSDLDIEFMQVWTMICQKIRLTKTNVEKMSKNPTELYQADFRELDEKGFYEVFKYTFKDIDICNYKVFKTMLSALDHRRIRQGYGELYNLQVEDVEVGELQDIQDFLFTKENPSNLLTREINDLLTTYKEYTKISRFTPNVYKDIID